ncbi:MAG: hypothetical protein XE08_0517 [Parcubacteria bacterium 32_520]|nr:MAG: hypothetical protein XE08_0517 [Parcubacteria bacterium 32_520]
MLTVFMFAPSVIVKVSPTLHVAYSAADIFPIWLLSVTASVLITTLELLTVNAFPPPSFVVPKTLVEST